MIASTLRIAARLVDERLDARRERVVGVVDEHVAGLEHAEQVGRRIGAGEHRLGLRLPGRVLELGPVERVQRPEPGEVERRVDDVDVLLGELELAAEQLEHLLAHVRVDLEPDHVARPLAQREHALDRLEEVLVLVFELEVGVAGDAERDGG